MLFRNDSAAGPRQTHDRALGDWNQPAVLATAHNPRRMLTLLMGLWAPLFLSPVHIF